MSSETPTVQFRNYTPAEILAHFRTAYGFGFENELGCSRRELTMESSIEVWMKEATFESWRHVGPCLANWFEFEHVKADWERLLRPAKERKLHGVCEYIAARSNVPVLKPVAVFGASDVKAGAFLTLKALLESHGADVGSLRPSTSLSEFATNGFPKLYSLLSRIHPGMTTRLHAKFRGELCLMLLAILLLGGTVACGVIGHTSEIRYYALGAVLFGIYLLVWKLSERFQRLPKRVDFKELSTFRQLCEALARPWAPESAPRCPQCNYPLIGLTAKRCPECGRGFCGEEFGMTDSELAASLEAAGRTTTGPA